MLGGVQNSLFAFTEADKSILFNYGLMAVSFVATFISASNRLSTKLKCFYIGAVFILLLIITTAVYSISGVRFWTVLIFLSLLFAFYYHFICSQKISRRKIDKMIIKITQLADHNKDIKLFGGDLDFFGNVHNGTIYKNEQIKQLEAMDFSQIKVLCIKPKNQEDDKAAILRLGYLINTFNSKIKVGFFKDNKCEFCEQIDDCFSCTVCDICKSQGCTVKKKCQYINRKELCPQLVKYKKLSCYNPDLDIRGRIITQSFANSESAAIFIKFKAGKSYIIREYNSQNRECKLYSDIWKIWWERCERDDEFLKKCKNTYLEYMNSNIAASPKMNFVNKLLVNLVKDEP